MEAVPSTGVRFGSITGVSVGGRGVGVSVSNAVGDETGSVAAGAVVCVGDGSALGADVCEGDEEVARTATGFAASVTEAVVETASGGEALVDSAVNGGEAGLRSSMKKRTNRRIATISLKRSYSVARLEVSTRPPKFFVLLVLQTLSPGQGSSPALRRSACRACPEFAPALRISSEIISQM